MCIFGLLLCRFMYTASTWPKSGLCNGVYVGRLRKGIWVSRRRWV